MRNAVSFKSTRHPLLKVRRLPSVNCYTDAAKAKSHRNVQIFRAHPYLTILLGDMPKIQTDVLPAIELLDRVN
jgi:hypothetical protein